MSKFNVTKHKRNNVNVSHILNMTYYQILRLCFLIHRLKGYLKGTCHVGLIESFYFRLIRIVIPQQTRQINECGLLLSRILNTAAKPT